MELVSIAQTLSTVIATGKQLVEVANKLKDAEAKNLVADLNLNIAELKMRIVELQEENARLKAQVAQAEDVSSFRQNLEIREQVYFFRTPVEGRAQGPYCPRCFDAGKQLVLVTAFTGAFRAIGKYNCPQCKANY